MNSSLPSCLLLLCLVQLILSMVTMDILSISSMMVLIVMTRRTNSAIRSQKNMKNVMLIMKFLIALLSVTLVSGAANPGHGDHGHIEYQQHDGPHCHDKKDQQCHKIPKEQEHEECYVDYEIVVDVTYIEECEYVTKTYCHEEQESRYHHSRIVGHDSRVVD